jgi:DnaK suppressor protein
MATKKKARKVPAKSSSKRPAKPARKPAPPRKPAKAKKAAPAKGRDAAKPKAKKPASKPAHKKVSSPKTGATHKKTRIPPFPIRGGRPLMEVAPQGAAKPRKLSPKFLEIQRARLLDLKDHILDQMQGVAQDSLRSNSDSSGGSAFGMHQGDAGSDAYEKDFALSLLSQEQDALYEINEALKRIENRTYGICEMTSKPIPQPRLEAIPYARYTAECQTQIERDQRNRSRWETSPQFMESAENFFEEAETAEGDDEERSRTKES